MKILLVYPVFPDTYWSFRHALVFEGKKSAFPPLGLLTVSAMLPETWERRLVDMNVEPLNETDIEWADIVFISAMMIQRESLDEVVNLAKARKKKIALGGPFVSTSPDACPDADFVFIGEVEDTLRDFVADLEADQPKHLYKSDDRPSLLATPVPDFGLIDSGKYSAMSLQYSRGCPFQCEFCDIIEIYGRVPRTKSNRQMIREMDALYRIGWRGLVFIVDDNFIGNRKNVKKLLPEIIDWSRDHGFPFSFITEASLNLAEDDELLQLMRDAGFRRVFLGIETPVEASLKEARKGQNTRRDLLDSVRKIQSFGMEVMGGFIVGFDNDPENVFDRQIEFIRESAVPLAMVGLLAALPNTQLWRRLAKEHRLVSESTGDNTDCTLNFVPRMERKRLIDGYKKILRNIYSPREFYRRALDCLGRFNRDAAEPRNSGFVNDLRMFGRILLTLGIKDPARLEFWKYLFNLLRSYPGEFAHGITLAAMGYHFRKLTDRYCED